MSVKQLLETQQAGFISLHDVLTKMTQIDGASYQEAATLLHRLLWSAKETQSRPEWHVCNSLYGRRKASKGQSTKAWDCLREATTYGDMFDDDVPF